VSDQPKTLFELAPDTFTVPGQSQNGTASLPDLVFQRDHSVPGMYRARIDRSYLSRNGHEHADITLKESSPQ
jgi:hypothetical protein